MEKLREFEWRNREQSLGLKDHPEHLLKPPKKLQREKTFKKASEIYNEERRELIGEVLRQPRWPNTYNDPVKSCKDPTSLHLVEFPGKKRGGPPRHNWWIEGVKEYWDHITNPPRGGEARFTAYNGTKLDFESREHLAILETAAESRIGLRGDKYNKLTTHTKIMMG